MSGAAMFIIMTVPGLTSQPGCYFFFFFLEEARAGPADWTGIGGEGAEPGGFKPAVFTSIRQARWRQTSQPISIVVVGVGGWGRG